MDQLTLFELPVKEKYREAKTMIGGIYRYKDDKEIYDGCFALAIGKDCFYFLIDGMPCIDYEVELGSAHNMKIVPGYALACVKKPDGQTYWQVRNSAIKGHHDYILQEGKAGPDFRRSLDPFMKVFMK